MISRIDTDSRRNKAMDFTQFSGDPEFMLSFAKGLVVLEAIGQGMDCRTIAKLSTVTGLSRAAVRRCLYTLSQLGYAAKVDGQGYAARTSLSIFTHTGDTKGLRKELARADHLPLSSEKSPRLLPREGLEADKP